MPAQTLVRLDGGYVGRWNVMHPLAIRIANTMPTIGQTIDWKYPLNHMESWDDVVILDTIEDGMTVSLTAYDYDQGQKIVLGGTPSRRLHNLKVWVTIPWSLDFHMAQIAHPVRLVDPDISPEADIRRAEQQVASVIDRFLAYVRSRRAARQLDYKTMSSLELMHNAIGRRQKTLAYGRLWSRLKDRGMGRLKRRLRRWVS